jgi:quercetin dioxygenase-like cupin family protein
MEPRLLAARLPLGRFGLVALVLAGLVTGLRPATLPRWIGDLCGAQGSPMLSAASVAGGEAHRPATVVRPLSCEPLPNVPGKSVTTALVDFPPGGYTGPHRHPGSVTAYVVSGTIRSQMAGGPAADYHAGQVWFEAPRALHLFAENASTDKPAQLLVTFVADANCGPLVIPEPQDE